MKLAIFSHCAIDSINLENQTHELMGGAACYGGITARKLKCNVELFTKYGKDFHYEEHLEKNKIKTENSLSEKPTTRFKIQITGTDRKLSLEKKCEPLEFSKSDADGFLISPLFDEISQELFQKIKNDSNFLFLDPQGFLRRVDSNNNIFLEKTDIDLKNVSAIKVGVDEITNLVGDSDIESMKQLQKKGIEYVLLTNKQDISMLVKDTIYSLTLPNKKIYDTTGVGDIFCSAFCCTMLRENDSMWAFCFAGGAAQAALDSRELGLEKIPEKGKIETNAAYFYNLLKFEHV